uniref:Peptidase C1A papain C-terminal domain-containing protein n=1 Tax=Nothoprocta perdicaria TaxID=30464 RepID=A0A8C7EC55_NOTPE
MRWPAGHLLFAPYKHARAKSGVTPCKLCAQVECSPRQPPGGATCPAMAGAPRPRRRWPGEQDFRWKSSNCRIRGARRGGGSGAAAERGPEYNVPHGAGWGGNCKAQEGRAAKPGSRGARVPGAAAGLCLPFSCSCPVFPGAVTPVKDQAVCGSCWSFATTGAMEGALFLKTGVLTPLSQQVLIDCSWGFGNFACDGGEEWRAYEWIKKHGGIASTESYGSYKGQVRAAVTAARSELLGKITGYVNVTSGNVTAVKTALYKHGPVAVSIDASHKSFSFYSNGVYYEPKCANTTGALDHAVLAVGYGVLQGETYWLVKNSWSTYWGNDGYILMAMRDNNCGVATEATYPVLA